MSTLQSSFRTLSKILALVVLGVTCTSYLSMAVSCSGTTTVTTASGTITDGSGDDDYDSNSNCAWLIDPPGDDIVRVEFTEFDIEDFFDFVRVYDGTSAAGRFLGQFDNNDIPDPMFATTGSMYITFSSDAFENYPGWSFNYSTVATVPFCGGHTDLSESSGTISDGSDFFNYETNASCSWYIQSTTNQVVSLTFSSFDLHTSDTVKVYDGSSTSGVLLGVFTGDMLPKTCFALSGEMYVTFDSDASGVSAGWSAQFNTKLAMHTGNFGVIYDKYQAWPGREFYDDLNAIYVAPSSGITRFHISNFEIGTDDTLKIIDNETGSVRHEIIGQGQNGADALVTQKYCVSDSIVLFSYSAGSSRHRAYEDGWRATYQFQEAENYIVELPNGTFSDGSCGINYEPNQNKSWFIQSTSNQAIVLEFESFAVHTSDIVFVYEGQNTSGTLLGTFTGSDLPSELLLAESGEMFVTFVSDDEDELAGWVARYKAITPVYCSDEVDDGFDDWYGTYVDTSYLYIVQPGRSTYFYFQHHRIGDDDLMRLRGIPSGEVIDELTALSDKVGWNYTTTSSVLVDFKSGGEQWSTPIHWDGTHYTEGGWRLRGRMEGDSLPTIVQSSAGNLDDGSLDCDYANSTFRTWHLQSTSSSAIVLRFEEFDVHESDSVFVYDGADNSSERMASLSNTGTTKPLVALSGNMFIEFVADDSDVASGWTARYQHVVPVTTCTAVLSDGSLEANYESNLTEFQVIQMQNAGDLRLSFLEFETHDSSDVLSIWDGRTTSSLELVDSMYGDTIPASIIATSSTVVVYFETDSISTASGWSLLSEFAGDTGDYTLSTSTGTISDGSGTCDYLSDIRRTWSISSTTGSAVVLEFTEFDVHESDTVFVYDGANDTGLLIGKFSGGELPSGVQVAVSGTLHVVFKTDSVMESNGWLATFRNASIVTYIDCSGVVEDGSGTNEYNNNEESYYLIEPTCEGVLRFDLLRSEFHTSEDTLVIANSLDFSEPLWKGNAGDSSLPVVYSTTGVLALRFQTDAVGVARGWLASYSTVATLDCVELVTTSLVSQRIDDNSGLNDYEPGLSCSWHIQSTQGTGVVLSFDEFDVHASDTLFVFDGNSDSGSLLGKYTDQEVPDRIVTTSGEIFLKFVTDESLQAPGWIARVSSATIISDLSAEVEDGSGLGNHDVYTDKYVVFSSSNQELKRFEFSAYDVPSTHHSVTLFDGLIANGDYISRYQGTTLPSVLHTTADVVLLWFDVSGGIAGAGWTLSYVAGSGHNVTSITPNGTTASTHGASLETSGALVGLTSVEGTMMSTDATVLWSSSVPYTWQSSTRATVHIPASKFTTTGNLVLELVDAIGRSSSVTVPIVRPFFGRQDYSIVHSTSSISVLENDRADSAALLSVETPNWGTATVAGNLITYTPDTEFYGLDNFEYTFGFEGGITSTGTVTAYTRPSGTSDKTLTQLERVQQGGEVNRLKRPRGAVVSADGEHLYVAAYSSKAVSHFTRAGNGELTYVDNVQGSNQGLTSITQVALSPDGEYLYTTSRSEFAVGIYSVHATTGSLTYVGKAVRNVDGVDGLKYAEDIVVSPDGRHVYTVSSGDHKLTVFTRNQTTRTLTYVERFKDGQGGVTKMRTPRSVAMSPDGKHVYVAAYSDNAVTVFSRAEETGKLAFVQHRKDNSGGVDGIYGASGVAVSPDGEQVFVSGYRDNALAVFARNQTTGTLTYTERFKDNNSGVDGLAGAYQTRTSPSGQHIFTAARAEHSVAHIGRNAITGAATYIERVKRNTDGVTGLYKIYNVAVDPESNTLYAMGNYDNSVTVFELDSHAPKRGADTAGHTQQLTEALAITNVFPLPATDYITIEFAEAYSNQTCTVLDLAGREVLKTYQPGSHITMSINTTTLESGSYFLLLESGPNKMLVEVVISR